MKNDTKISKQDKMSAIFRIIADNDVTNYEISKNTGVSEAGLGSITNGETKNPRELTINAIYEYLMDRYGDFSASREGTINISGNNHNIAQGDRLAVSQEGGGFRVPYYDMDFVGGFSSEDIFSHNAPSFYISSPTFERAEFACNLVGNSISKRIPSGSIIGLREINDWQVYFPTNELYAVVLKNDLRTVKVVKRDKQNKNILLLIPDAKEEFQGYDIEEVPIDFVTKIFQVVAWASFEKLAM